MGIGKAQLGVRNFFDETHLKVITRSYGYYEMLRKSSRREEIT